MNITLNSSEAQTLYNTGRLIRTVDCDWQPPQNPFSPTPKPTIKKGVVKPFYVYYIVGATQYQKGLTPPLEVGAVYDVIEPCFSTEVRSNSLVITYGDSPIGKYASGTASRQQATPTYKLIFEEGKLRWYEELKRV